MADQQLAGNPDNDLLRQLSAAYPRLSSAFFPESDSRHVEQVSLSQAEAQLLIATFNQEETPYPEDKSLIDLFINQAGITPDFLAVVFNDKSLTYSELNIRSNQLARYLQKQGVNPGSLVPVCIERGLEMIIALLGVSKAGAAYVPIDPATPLGRINFMLKDTGASIIISNRTGSIQLNSTLQVVELDSDWALIEIESQENLEVSPAPGDLLHVIYTSGSTGHPKGVMIEHQSIVNLVTGSFEQVDLSPKSIFLSVTTFTFDIFYFELYRSLIHGAKIIIVPKEISADGNLLKQTLAYFRPTHMQATPATWQMLADEGWNNDEQIKMLTGGESIKADLKDYLVSVGDLFNGYGPTETSVYATLAKIEPGQRVTIGKPVPNTRIYILNSSGQVCPIGVLGEICIAGVQVARGYLNNIGMTTEKFVVDPFSNEAGARMYKSGDLGQWLPDGNIEFRGRLDDQVKIHGHRIELSEIEIVLNQSSLVIQGVVLAREDSYGNKRLVGYVVPKGLIDRQGIHRHLSEQLPSYMVPLTWVELKSIPLTQSGKTDRKILPVPDLSYLNAYYTKPRNQTERSMLGIWQDLLGLDQIGIHDNFFELGGHSILAVRIVSAVRRKLSVSISILDLFAYPTIAGLSDLVDHGETASSVFVPMQKGDSKVPLYMICGCGGTVFNFTGLVRLMHPKQAVYGLQQPADARCVEKFPDTVEEIAALYIREIVKQNPVGPYALSGHSAGGIVAHEMAIQLRNSGRKVAFLGLFDAGSERVKTSSLPLTVKHSPIASLWLKLLPAIKIKFGLQVFMLFKHPKLFYFYKVRNFKLRLGINLERPEKAELIFFSEMTVRFEKAIEEYRVQYYPGHAVLFYARQKYLFTDLDNQLRYRKLKNTDQMQKFWKEHTGTLMTYNVQGDHRSMLYPEYAANLAKILQNQLDQCTVLASLVEEK